MKISELRVLESAAGYYIGRTCVDEDGFSFPYSRNSAEYYATEEEAEQALYNRSFTYRDYA